MKQILSALILVLASTAFAGHEVGNGGGVIVCVGPQFFPPQPNADKVELLDLFEAREFRKLPLGLGDPNEDYNIKIDRVLTQLERIAPYRGQLYRNLYNRFMDESVFVANIDLVYIPDSEYKGLPTNCSLKQAVIQQPPEFLGDKRYTVSLDLWNKLDNNSKAALVLHEIIYNEGIALYQQSSKGVRYLNSYMTSATFNTLTQDNFNRMLLSAGFDMIDAFNTFVLANSKTSPNYFVSINNLTDLNLKGYYQTLTGTEEYYKQIKLTNSFKYNGMLILTNAFSASGGAQSLYAVNGVVNYTPTDLSSKIVSSSNDVFTLYFENLKAVGFLAIKQGSEDTVYSASLNGFTAVMSFDTDSAFYPNAVYLLLNNNLDLNFQGLKTKNAFFGRLTLKQAGTSQYNIHFHENGLISDSGTVLSGFLSQTSILNTAQGPLSFEPSQLMAVAPSPTPLAPVVQNEPTLFNVNGTVNTGYLSPHQTVNTANGPVTLTTIRRVHFLENGLVEIKPVSVPSDT